MKDIDTNHLESTTTVEVELNPDDIGTSKEPFITETNNRGFRIKTAGLYGCIHLILCFWTFYYLHDRHGKHENLKKWFRNYDYVGNGYDIVVTCLLLVSLGLLSFWYKLAKSIAGYGLIAIILMSYVYLVGYILRIACKSSIDLDEEICKAYVALWCAGFGMLISASFTSLSFRKDIGMMIGGGMYVVMLILWRYVYEMDNPQIWVTALYLLGFCAYSWYINEALFIMVTKRTHIYTAYDWPVAFGHLQTDIFAKFWIDLFKKKNPPIIDEQEMGNDFEIAIQNKEKSTPNLNMNDDQMIGNDFDVMVTTRGDNPDRKM
jgi:hypothetical protein